MTERKQMSDSGLTTRDLEIDELNAVSGGGRTNGDNPVVKAVVMAAKETFYQGMWYSSQGWKS